MRLLTKKYIQSLKLKNIKEDNDKTNQPDHNEEVLEMVTDTNY